MIWLWPLSLLACSGPSEGPGDDGRAGDSAAAPPDDTAIPDDTGGGGDTSGDAPGGTWDLTDPAAWSLLAAEADPFDDRPEEDWCFPEALEVEYEILEVETGLCAYLSAAQPSLAEIRPGDRIEVLVYHSSLTADAEAEAHAAIAIGGEVVWEEPAIPIPSTSAVYSAEVEAPRGWGTGEQVVFHLHNHGSNTWNLGHLRVTRD